MRVHQQEHVNASRLQHGIEVQYIQVLMVERAAAAVKPLCLSQMFDGTTQHAHLNNKFGYFNFAA